jgi:hypothetical protein
MTALAKHWQEAIDSTGRNDLEDKLPTTGGKFVSPQPAVQDQ